LARHLWGGAGSRLRIPFTGVMVYTLVAALTLVPTMVFAPLSGQQKAIIAALAFVAGLFGAIIAWLAWYGAVESLPKITRREAQDAQAALQFPCGICGGPVSEDVKADCVYKCGRVFHVGCYQTRQSMGTGAACAVCGFTPAG
jgi:hypothetical protein